MNEPLSIKKVLTILYVTNQQKSTLFYQAILGTQPILNVPGMTEFTLAPDVTLGLMPNESIAKILLDKTPHPNTGNGIPRCELYIYVDDVTSAYKNATNCGAKLISEFMDRNWGDKTCYFADPDGHIIAFAQKLISLL
ncbi:MAG: VOC family protein [Bacteroidia bacterium]|nr:VOC family protein [Bacteroidia bacterium]